MKKSILDDGFQAYLTEGAFLVGDPGIPMLMDLGNARIPKDWYLLAKQRLPVIRGHTFIFICMTSVFPEFFTLRGDTLMC